MRARFVFEVLASKDHVGVLNLHGWLTYLVRGRLVENKLINQSLCHSQMNIAFKELEGVFAI